VPAFERYYEILGVEPGSSPEEIRQAWRDLAQVWHPDRFTTNERLQQKAQDKLKEVNEAYEALRDPLALLKQGVQKWNMWRKKWSDLTPKLIGVRVPRGDYTGIDLRDMDLSKSNFSDAALYKADLSGVTATGAVFAESELSRATLLGARLTRCDLRYADLSSADLSSARIVECNLLGANLVGTILDNARLETGVSMTEVQLEGALTNSATRLPNLG
jgi:uncharacterized protein YjbI with pentapeptide repeats